ncbi:helix-turn-helix transcriptional regulator [Methylobacterium sp. BTF04]|uniref:helix-turn-helix domain-containing protein n=1 Tax=Methylobacterium sp. BTF04 TaxID=2708300 RepID=UPI0013D444A7|nr:helix-turn-helix transcriptional regulator [Methylobacterium sp. BTF04]NEU13710.1 helix-turn-helix transcriptional regulator [Methylobacterium sp. BTF04]
MTIVRTKTPSGEAIVILPEAEFEQLLALAEDAADSRALTASQDRLGNGTDELLSEDDLDDLRKAPTPLAFWRERRGLTVMELAESSGISDTVLAGMERGERGGDIGAYRALAEALGVDMDDVVPNAEAA